jgi:glycosyltransferase involved in cell wall biosynthesis
VRRTLRLPVGEVTPWLYGPWSPGLLAAVRNAARTSDVVVGCTAPFTTALAPGWFRRGASARRMVLPLLHVSSSAPHPAVRRALRRSDAVIALTAFERDVAVELGVDPARVAIIPAGTDPDAYADLTAPEARARVGLPDRPTVGFVGRLAAYKGIDTLLDAAPALWERRPETTVLIAGSPSGWSGYRDAGVTALAGDRLVVREGFEADQRPLLLAACDVVVHPSREESFGMVAIESWAARRPIVVADIPAVRSLVEPGRAGELVPPGDAPALARALVDLLGDPDRARRQGAAGRADVEARFSWDHIGADWERLAADVVAGASDGGA